MLRSISLTSTHMPQKKLALDPPILAALCAGLGSTKEALVYRSVYLIAFFSFERRSNLVPDSASSIDKHRHLCRGDLFLENGYLIILIKWSKTLQCHERVVTVPLAAIPNHPLCPVTAYQDMVAAIPCRGRQRPAVPVACRLINGAPHCITAHQELQNGSRTPGNGPYRVQYT